MGVGQLSFRRILLSRLLLVSVPVLLMGVYVTYRKARSAFLETARQNLTQSSIRQGESIRQSIEGLQGTLVTASDSVVLKAGSLQDKQKFIEQLTTTLATEIKCIQLKNLTSQKLIANTCQKSPLTSNNKTLWPKKQTQLLTSPEQIIIQLLPPKKSSFNSSNQSQFVLLLTAPVYDSQGQLRYALKIQSTLLKKNKINPGFLTGYPVIITQYGVILVHPLSERIGHNIKQEDDTDRIESLMGRAIAGQPNFLHLFSLDKNGLEVVAGYSSIPSPVTQDKGEKWVILAVSPLEYALSPLSEIKRVLLWMIFALAMVSLLAILYIAWELSRPVEKLRDYALNKDTINAKETIPINFKIRELNQLGMAINDMVERLKLWGEEIVLSWQEAQNANRLKSEFLATTSHELRTPLNGIIGCIHIIKQGFCDSREEELEFLSQAEESAIHLLKIINDVLDLAKIEAGHLSIKIELCDINQLLLEVVYLQIAPIQTKDLTLNIIDNKQEIFVNADPSKLKQVILNIISNAIKFTDKGSITIATEIKIKDDNKQVYIIIKDTGIGIDPAQQDKLFRPFVMIDASKTRKYSGTGLGLAISRNFMELMGGTITLSSPGLGLGTRVEICLPLVTGDVKE
ncbi:sensor histidine kinase [Aphanothece sacrum]|uniref:Circadian input-output histidine kinase CikA n=1 Tax=Aphanothece sacrum FPU1 TaxID=1920663 RepID=A0A401IJI9_APHSA|nr:ATP-binding protein [Aphanothece sacrum]GBF81458.1 two-component sensor histidine kinase [Aphanothece sacrum FPU1]GBF85589.1 two-component sensor histidine kinase [Aphanothece sacrum FPU3]